MDEDRLNQPTIVAADSSRAPGPSYGGSHALPRQPRDRRPITTPRAGRLATARARATRRCLRLVTSTVLSPFAAFRRASPSQPPSSLSRPGPAHRLTACPVSPRSGLGASTARSSCQVIDRRSDTRRCGRRGRRIGLSGGMSVPGCVHRLLVSSLRRDTSQPPGLRRRCRWWRAGTLGSCRVMACLVTGHVACDRLCRSSVDPRPRSGRSRMASGETCASLFGNRSIRGGRR
jgi:hypothetical protein